MSAGEKVITVLRDRLELEHLVEGMLEIRSEEEFASRARHIAESSAQVIPVILTVAFLGSFSCFSCWMFFCCKVITA